MISRDFVSTMARYGAWQNSNQFAAAATLDDAARRTDRGAFFGSIHATLNHILWADVMWMSRFTPRVAKPAVGNAGSTSLHEDFEALRAARHAFDDVVIAWADTLDAADLEGDLTYYSSAAGRDMTRPRWLLVTHLFNHGAHHRGQVHAMLTAAGAMPDVTDLPFMPDEVTR